MGLISVSGLVFAISVFLLEICKYTKNCLSLVTAREARFSETLQERINGTEKASPHTSYSIGNSSSRVIFKTTDPKGD